MKRLLKKIAAVIATAAIAVSAMVVTTASASAAGVFDNAIKMEQLEYYTRDLEENSITYYKITLPSDGKLILRCSKAVGAGWTRCCLLNSNAETVSDNWRMGNNWEDAQEIKKGTYYAKITSGTKQTLEDFYYTFTPSKKPTISLKLTVTKGSSIQLGSVVENYTGKVSWVSTKKTVATVSSTGKVTTKKAGTTTIRAQLESGEYVQIRLVVKNPAKKTS